MDIVILKSRWREIAAYLVSAFIVLCGGYFSVHYEAVWLNRAGSLVICVGIVFAASRVNEVLSAKVGKFVAENFERVFSTELKRLQEECSQPISAIKQSELKEKLCRDVMGEVGTSLDERKRRFKLHEVIIIIVGTLLNGFGDWLVCLFKCHLPVLCA